MARSRRRGSGQGLTHVDDAGRVRMVDVTAKAPTAREAVARGFIRMSAEARRQITAGSLRKGDALETARLAGIMAAKQTSALIPLCHPLPISHADVRITPGRGGFSIEARVRTTAATGVEMEAMTAIAVAALTVYDMAKAVDKAMVIGEIRLIEKHGGKSGPWSRDRAERVSSARRRSGAGRRGPASDGDRGSGGAKPPR